MTLHVFDFDGTLTTRDTLLAFIRYARGTKAFVFGFVRYSPLLVLMKLHLYPNYKAKQKVFAHFFKGLREADFNRLCARFAAHSLHLLRLSALSSTPDPPLLGSVEGTGAPAVIGPPAVLPSGSAAPVAVFLSPIFSSLSDSRDSCSTSFPLCSGADPARLLAGSGRAPGAG